MAKLFIVLSTPVRMDDGGFAVVTGSIAGTDVKRFNTWPDAESYYRMLVGSLRIAVDIPFEYILVDSETDYLPLRQKLDREVERLSGPQQAISSRLLALTTRLGKATATMIGGLGRSRH